ncbi:ankyrin repeat domain-containing protein [Brachyspira sp.]|uniref:ankyrin repeat domain-containing protein n=1 Tax=Brachyspira sp. TaxID=1977261 RepID=UPI003D7E91B4
MKLLRRFEKIFVISLSVIIAVSCSGKSGELASALNKHKNDRGIENIRELIKEKDYEEAFYQSASSGYSDIVAGLVKFGADINAKSIDGATPLITLCREGDIEAAGILIENGADMSITDDRGKKALDYLKNKKDILEIVANISMKENYIVSEKFRNFTAESDDIDSLLNEINNKVISEMNKLLKKEYSGKPSAKLKYEFNTIIENANARNFDFGEREDLTSCLKKVGNDYYYIMSVGAPISSIGQREYLDSYTSLWLIKGVLSIVQFGKRSASFVGGFNGMPLTEDINIVSKGDYFTLEDYSHFGDSKYDFKYYTFKKENGEFYLDRISLIDNRKRETALYRYNSRDRVRVSMDEVSYSLIGAFLGMNYY